jgi:dTMP kinase
MTGRLKFFGEGLPYLDVADATGTLITVEGTDSVGRTTQIAMLREWLELRGHGVIETGWTRSELAGATITRAKEIRALNKFTYALLYAADFADRLEKEILPALRGGFTVLADRYVFTAFARALVRGADTRWVRDLYGFAPMPDLVIYLKADVATVIRRAIPRGTIDPFEAGMDIGLGDDLYDSFKKYQSMLIAEYNRMADEFSFHTVDATADREAIQHRLRQIVGDFFESRK